MRTIFNVFTVITTSIMLACTSVEFEEPLDVETGISKLMSEITTTRASSDLGELVPYDADSTSLPLKIQPMSGDYRTYSNRDHNLSVLSNKGGYFIKNAYNNHILYIKDNVLTVSPTQASLFLIQTFPPSTGIPYMIYSMNYPLTVGYYSNKPDEKLVMLDKTGSTNIISSRWDILDGNHSQGSVVFESQSYISSGPSGNYWDMYYNVWTIKNSTNLRFDQYTKNNSQEFYLEVLGEWQLKEIRYNTEYAIITDNGSYSMTETVTNDLYTPVPCNLTFKASINETSNFNEVKTGLRFVMHSNNTSFLSKRPTVSKNGGLVVDNLASPDTRYLPYNTIYTPIELVKGFYVPARTKLEVTYHIKKYAIKVDYEADIRSDYTSVATTICQLVGTWEGTRYCDMDLEPDIRLTNLDTGEIVIMSLPQAKEMKLIKEKF